MIRDLNVHKLAESYLSGTSIEDLCLQFTLSRTKLYKILKEIKCSRRIKLNFIYTK
jgi:Mor family transcriptional regulator